MTLRELENRIAQLESTVSQLRARVETNDKPSWQRAIEKYAGDEDLLAVFAEAKKLREADRKKARGGRSRSSAKVRKS